MKEELKTLNIPHAAFSVCFNEYSQEDTARAGENGLDEISFMFSANAGEPQKPLSKIISGGEMSRFMLAIKTQLSAENGISTYVFDEIDAGISGKTLADKAAANANTAAEQARASADDAIENMTTQTNAAIANCNSASTAANNAASNASAKATAANNAAITANDAAAALPGQLQSTLDSLGLSVQNGKLCVRVERS